MIKANIRQRLKWATSAFENGIIQSNNVSQLNQDMVENLSTQVEQLEQKNCILEVRLNNLKTDRNEWKHRAEAAEMDITNLGRNLDAVVCNLCKYDKGEMRTLLI